MLRDSATVDQMRLMMLALTTFSETTYEDFEIPEDVSAYAQAQFIAVRQTEYEADGKIKTDDAKFHRYLTFARYLSVANGELQLTKACYDYAVEIEDARESRQQAAATPKKQP